MTDPIGFATGMDFADQRQQREQLHAIAMQNNSAVSRENQAKAGEAEMKLAEAQRYQQFQQQQRQKQAQSQGQQVAQGGQGAQQQNVDPFSVMDKFVSNAANQAADEAANGFTVQSDANMKKATDMMEKITMAREKQSISQQNNIKTEIGKIDYLGQQMEVVKSFAPELRQHYFELAKKDYVSKFGPIPEQIANLPYSDKLVDSLQASALSQKDRLHAQQEASRVKSENENRASEIKHREILNRKEMADAKIAEERLDDIRKNGGKYGKDAVVGSANLTKEGMAVYEELIKTGRPIPKDGRGKVDSTILNSMGSHQEGGAGSGSIAGAQADYKANTSAYTAITKDLAALEPYKKMLDLNGNVAIDLGKKIVQSDSALANKPLNWLKKNMGDHPDAREYLFQINTLQTEAARVLSNPRLVGQLSDSARHEMQDVANGDMPINSMERVIHRMQKDGEFRVTEMRNKKEELHNQLSGKKEPESGKKESGGNRLPQGVTLSPGVHVDGKGKKIEVYADGTYKEM